MLLQQREEQIFLAREMRIKGAPRVARLRGYTFDASRLKTIPGKDLASGAQQLAARRLRLLLVFVQTLRSA